MGREPGVMLTAGELSLTNDPAALLEHAWAMEPGLRLSERYAALDRLTELLEAGAAPDPPPGRDWEMELLAERAFDAAAYVRLEEGRELAERVLSEADPSARIARARATLALGRALAWVGTEEATRRGDAALRDAIEQFRLLDHTDWLGFTIFWRGHAICFQNGDLLTARELIGEGLAILGPQSPRRSVILTFYADVLTDLGELDAADAVLDEADLLARRDGFARSRAYTAWSRARVAAGRDDAAVTQALLRAVEEADATDWFATMTGLDFLADAATLLDRVGLTGEARDYLGRARDRVVREGATTDDGSSYDEPLLAAEASLMARSDDPHQALAKLQVLVRGNWLEKRLIWRTTLLTAWATLRAGSREDAGTIAARALAEAANTGGTAVALAGEGTLTRALAPLADEAGSGHARDLLSDHTKVMIRLFGSPTITMADGRGIPMPAGMPGELLRLLALHPQGLAGDAVLDTLFPGTDRATALPRLRQVLKRVRVEAGDLVLRDAGRLTLAPAWIDIREFSRLVESARGARNTRRLELAWSALALAQRGPLLVTDPYAPWAAEIRARAASDTVELSSTVFEKQHFG